MSSATETPAFSGGAITVAIAGDLYPEGRVCNDFLRGDGQRYLGALDKGFGDADLRIINLETPLCTQATPRPKCGSNFQAPPAFATALQKQGVDMATLANNHIMDQGEAGLRTTLETLDALAFPHCGAGLTHEDACRPAVARVRGQTVAILNFAEGEFAEASGEGAGTARIDPYWTEQRVANARAQHDYVLVVLHTGNEHQPIPSPSVVDVCHRMAAAGAHAVVAHHPHIPNADTVVDGVPIVYSLGNLLLCLEYDEKRWRTRPCWHLGSLARITLANGKATMQLIPFRQMPDLTLAQLSAQGHASFDRYITRGREILRDPSLHERYWNQEVRGLFGDAMAHLKQIGKDIDATDLEARKWAATLLYSYTHCHAHHTMLLSATRMIMEDQFDDDAEAAQGIEELQDLIRGCFAD